VPRNHTPPGERQRCSAQPDACSRFSETIRNRANPRNGCISNYVPWPLVPTWIRPTRRGMGAARGQVQISN